MAISFKTRKFSKHSYNNRNANENCMAVVVVKKSTTSSK